MPRRVLADPIAATSSVFKALVNILASSRDVRVASVPTGAHAAVAWPVGGGINTRTVGADACVGTRVCLSFLATR